MRWFCFCPGGNTLRFKLILWSQVNRCLGLRLDFCGPQTVIWDVHFILVVLHGVKNCIWANNKSNQQMFIIKVNYCVWTGFHKWPTWSVILGSFDNSNAPFAILRNSQDQTVHWGQLSYRNGGFTLESTMDGVFLTSPKWWCWSHLSGVQEVKQTAIPNWALWPKTGEQRKHMFTVHPQWSYLQEKVENNLLKSCFCGVSLAFLVAWQLIHHL